MTKQQEIDYQLNQVKALNEIRKVSEAKNSFTYLLANGASSSILKEAYNSFSKGDLGKTLTDLYMDVIKHLESEDK